MIKKIFKSSKGFTVLESIVAIFILSLSVSGAFSAVQQSFSQAIIAKDEVQAFYLAQEAIEIIRNTRDNNQLAKISGGGNTWLTGISQNPSDQCYFGKICRMDSGSMSLSFNYCGAYPNSCPFLKQSPTTFLYGYNSGNDTNFKREIMIERVQNDTLGNPVEIAVTVRVSWLKGTVTREFKVKTYLFNWI